MEQSTKKIGEKNAKKINLRNATKAENHAEETKEKEGQKVSAAVNAEFIKLTKAELVNDFEQDLFDKEYEAQILEIFDLALVGLHAREKLGAYLPVELKGAPNEQGQEASSA